MKRNFPRKQTKPNRLNYNTKGLKKKHIFKRSMHRQSQIYKSKFTTCTEKKITKKESIETNSITNETKKKRKWSLRSEFDEISLQQKLNQSLSLF